MNKYFFVFCFLVPFFCYSENAIESALKSYQDDKTSEFSSIGNSKSQGLKLILKIPSSFQKNDGIRPHILNTYTSIMDSNNGVLSIAIQVNDHPTELQSYSDMEVADFLFSDEIISESFKNYRVMESIRTKYDGQPGHLSIITNSTSRSGLNFTNIVCIHRFIFNKKLISITCIYAVQTEKLNVKIDSIYPKFKILNTMIGNSIVIMNKWEK